MNNREGFLYWSRRVVAIDQADGKPIAIVGQRRGNKLSWRPVDMESVRDGRHGAILTNLPVHPGMTAWVETPVLGRRKERHILPSVLDTKLPFPLEDCSYACSEPLPAIQSNVPVDGVGMAALAIVVRNSDLEKVEATRFAADGIQPIAYDHEGLALWSELSHAGDDRVQVVVWCREASVLLVLGVGDVYWGSHRLEVYDINRVMQWIRLQLQTTAGGTFKEAPVTWWVGGAKEQVNSFLALLQDRSRKDVNILPDGEYYVARAMAQRALCRGSWRLNAISGTAGAAAMDRFVSRRWMQNTWFLLLAAGILFAVGGGRQYYLNRELQITDQQLQQTVNDIAGYAVTARGVHAVNAAREELQARRDALRPYKTEVELSSLLGRVAGIVSDLDGYIESVDLDLDSASVTIWLPADASTEDIQSEFLTHGYVMDPVEKIGEDENGVRHGFRGDRSER